jgi:hypothetical protein
MRRAVISQVVPSFVGIVPEVGLPESYRSTHNARMSFGESCEVPMKGDHVC